VIFFYYFFFLDKVFIYSNIQGIFMRLYGQQYVGICFYSLY